MHGGDETAVSSDGLAIAEGILPVANFATQPVLCAVVFCLAWGIGQVARKGEGKEETAIGFFFSTMALGILFIGLTHGYNVDLVGYLFGSILEVTSQDLWITLGRGAAMPLVVGLFFKELLFVRFDPEMAAAQAQHEDGQYRHLSGWGERAECG